MVSAPRLYFGVPVPHLHLLKLIMLDEAGARAAVQRWLSAKQFSVPMETKGVVETPRSWVFELVAKDGQLLLGNAPLVVDKKTGTIVPCREAWREFGTSISRFARLKRRWHRWFTY
jgi:hypothetical protein